MNTIINTEIMTENNSICSNNNQEAKGVENLQLNTKVEVDKAAKPEYTSEYKKEFEEIILSAPNEFESSGNELHPLLRIVEGHLPNGFHLPSTGIDLKKLLTVLEWSYIQQALEITGGVVAHAADKLSMRRTTLVEKLRKYKMLKAVDESK